MLSDIQNKILTKLLNSSSLRYSECIPADTDRDLFNYHFRELKKKGLICKRDDSYSLTDHGKIYVQRLDALGEFKEYFRFSVIVFLIDRSSDDSRILLHKRLRHPYFADVGGISGKVKYGESINETCIRKMKEETGLDISKTRLIGVHRKTRLNQNKEIIEDTLYHCCIAESYEGDLLGKTEFGENFWSSLDNAFEYEKVNIAGSEKGIEVFEIIKDGNTKDIFYFEEVQTLLDY